VLPDVSRVQAATAVAAGRKSRVAPALGLAVLIAGGTGATFLIARQMARPTSPPTTTTGSTATHAPAVKPTAAKPAATWLVPHAVAGETLATDETFKSDGVRVQSTAKRDAALVRDAYRGVLAELRTFLSASGVPAAQALAAKFGAPPLNLVIVPQSMLDTPSLWPDFTLSANSTYASRYLPAKRTLFVNDSPGFTRRDLPYGVALHVLTPVQALSNDDILQLAEKFEAYYNLRHPK
jgi:hypothetical protein